MASCKATTLSSLSSPQAAVLHRGVDLFLSLSLSLTLTLTAALTSLLLSEKHSSNIKQFALGHIYTNMTFGLFTNIASTALGNIFTDMSPHPVSAPHRTRIHIFIRLRSRVLFIRLSPGLPSSGPCRVSIIRSLPGTLHTGSGHPIRRDRNPNNLPLHFGMGCLSSPILFRHASSLSGVSTLVSISDPFSSVWIFVSTNSWSSILSRIQ